MKRMHLFEFEDLAWFPGWIRTRMTRLINVIHKMLGTRNDLGKLVAEVLNKTGSKKIVDLCSGSGGPMLDVHDDLKNLLGQEAIELILTDLYPDQQAAAAINNREKSVSYQTEPIDATDPKVPDGLRTMVCSFHHMKPEKARKILAAAQEGRQPICIFEISDNSFPAFLWWVPLPINFILCLFITPFARPMSWQQLVFTFLIPIIPICYAWDGAVSNARTYTLKDLDILLEGLDSEDYCWEKGVIEGKAKKLYLIGIPT